jgi:hypothetical protein
VEIPDPEHPPEAAAAHLTEQFVVVAERAPETLLPERSVLGEDRCGRRDIGGLTGDAKSSYISQAVM